MGLLNVGIDLTDGQTASLARHQRQTDQTRVRAAWFLSRRFFCVTLFLFVTLRAALTILALVFPPRCLFLQVVRRSRVRLVAMSVATTSLSLNGGLRTRLLQVLRTGGAIGRFRFFPLCMLAPKSRSFSRGRDGMLDRNWCSGYPVQVGQFCVRRRNVDDREAAAVAEIEIRFHFCVRQSDIPTYKHRRKT